ncbi:MAG TPA: carboxypeptidase regulatory-like domain-containing protein, partial [Candidatus Moranbacteria bacterium]|nr:carboxypeptidase regulatory-like domain-containing protein [Candidatus Moranbacteria bacterium]
MSESSVKRIFFWILVISFLATAPAIVFYTMGYRFSMERGIFVYSGSITLKPTPREVNVFIDDKQVSKGVINFLNYSYHIDGLTPGAHSLRVEAPGYYEWFKKVHIHSGLSSEFWNIFLI